MLTLEIIRFQTSDFGNHTAELNDKLSMLTISNKNKQKKVNWIISLCENFVKSFRVQCSASCGGGLQHRLIKCVDTRTEASEEVDRVQCDHKLKPNDTKKCNVRDCESDPSGE